MGTTLENGVYLPSEGERNCYAGLKTNWEILDQKVADVTALQQAVAGALHREIVESLPTTDIDPNTIYMILSGTSATENVYNEYMYVNNAWELIGTSATDLTNYYTKAEVDGKLLLKANASDLTSHTGNTTIHVTASDKNRWNNQTYVFRYSSTALVASSTNSNTLLDNTDNLKVGDKVIDSSGVLFSITAIDTQNSTFTIGTALIDLAQDSDVVHKSGNETVGGNKTFTNSIQLKSNVAEYGVTGGNIQFYLMDKNGVSLSKINQGVYNNGISYITLQLYGKDSNNQTITNSIAYQYAGSFNNTYLLPTDNSVWLGSPGNRWGKIYGIQYYYGSNNVEFSTKFVTTDTNQTISGNKTFSDNPVIGNNNTNITISNRQVTANSSYSAPTGNSYSYIQLKAMLNYTDSSPSIDATVGLSVQENAYSDGKNRSFHPSSNNLIDLGLPDRHWANVYATNYYYGSNNVEFSQKFVTTDTNQTISGTKTFEGVDLKLKSVAGEYTVSSGNTSLLFYDKNSLLLSQYKQGVFGSGISYQNFSILGYDSNNQQLIKSITFSSSNLDLSTAYLKPDTDNAISLGRNNNKWSDIQTYKVNGVQPSSLSLPSYTSSRIDISSYITNLTGGSNNYTAPANGYIFVRTTNGTYLKLTEYPSGVCSSVCSQTADDIGTFLPVNANRICIIAIKCSSIDRAYFIPCQGNV